jgi:holo-ACP synthase CitX
MAFDMDPLATKQRCVALEARHPFARLIDLDVYSAQGVQIDRSHLDLSGRRCLVCEQPAVECIRVKRHSYDEVIGKVNELLAYFRT